MDTVLLALLVIALVLLGVTSLGLAYERSQEMTEEGWAAMQDRALERSQTAISIESAVTAGQTITVTVRNAGEERLSDFAAWDVIVQYYASTGTYYVESIPHDSWAPDSPQWTIEGIYRSVASTLLEVYEPGILNPGEEARIVVTVTQAPDESAGVMTTISTTNGATASFAF